MFQNKDSAWSAKTQHLPAWHVKQSQVIISSPADLMTCHAYLTLPQSQHFDCHATSAERTRNESSDKGQYVCQCLPRLTLIMYSALQSLSSMEPHRCGTTNCALGVLTHLGRIIQGPCGIDRHQHQYQFIVWNGEFLSPFNFIIIKKCLKRFNHKHVLYV